MSAVKDAWRGLPKRNRKIAISSALVFVAMVGLTIYLFSSGGSSSPQSHGQSAQSERAAGHGRLGGQSTPGLGQGQMDLNPQYRRTKREQEKKRAQKTRQEHKSYYPSLRPDLQFKGQSGDTSLALGGDGAANGGGHNGADGSSANGDQRLDPGQCLVTDANGNPKLDHEGQRMVGIRLPNGQCMLPNGDVYNAKGVRVVHHEVDEPSAGSPTGSSAAAANNQRAKQKRIADISSYLGKLDKQEKEREKVKLAKKKRTKKTPSSGPSSSGPSPGSGAPAKVPSGSGKPPFHGFQPGNMLLAILDTPINSDTPTQARFIVVSGPLQGATILGTPTLKGKYVVIKMSYLTWKNHHAKINAYAVDAGTHLGALQGNVDSHFVARLSAALVYGLAKGARDVALNQGTTTTTATGSVVTRPSGSTKQIVQAGVGSAADVLTQPLKKYISQPNTVTVPRHTVVGVMFAEPTPVPWAPEAALKEARQL